MNCDDLVLLLIDLQKESSNGVEGFAEVIDHAVKLSECCRANGIPVIYTRHVYCHGAMDAALHEPLDAHGRPLYYAESSEGVAFHEAAKPQPGDYVVDKQRWSAFYASELELLLRRFNRRTLIVGGFVTDGCVLNTVYDAFYRDYDTILVADMAAATSQLGHAMAVINMANWVYGIEIVRTSELLTGIGGEAYRAWKWQEPGAFQPALDDVFYIYQQLLS